MGRGQGGRQDLQNVDRLSTNPAHTSSVLTALFIHPILCSGQFDSTASSRDPERQQRQWDDVPVRPERSPLGSDSHRFFNRCCGFWGPAKRGRWARGGRSSKTPIRAYALDGQTEHPPERDRVYESCPARDRQRSFRYGQGSEGIDEGSIGRTELWSRTAFTFLLNLTTHSNSLHLLQCMLDRWSSCITCSRCQACTCQIEE